VDPFFSCPAGSRAWRRRRQAVRVTEYGGAAGCGALYTILRSSSERLCRLCVSLSSLHRQRLCGNINPASGLRGLVNRGFPLEMFLASLCSCVGFFFCFLCYEPIKFLLFRGYGFCNGGPLAGVKETISESSLWLHARR
jgi:hypothetical protein